MSTTKVYNTNCCVFGCHSRKGRNASIHFHLFPKPGTSKVHVTNAFGLVEEVDRRKAWENAVRSAKKITSTMKVCSLHFHEKDYVSSVLLSSPKLKFSAVPSRNLPKPSSYRTIQSLRKDRYERRQVFREKSLNLTVEPTFHEDEVPIPSTSSFTEQIVTTEELSVKEREAAEALLKLSNTRQENIDKSVQVTSADCNISFADTVITDAHLNSLTGLPSLELLSKLVTLIQKFYPDQKRHKLTVKDRIILVFMKLKLALKFNILSYRFKISNSSCRNNFDECVTQLANVLKPCVVWPSVENIEQNLPFYFDKFKNVRVIIDCTEIPVQASKCLCCRIRTYSYYKGRQTIKFMMGVSPGGLITFVSKAYGGRSSDKAIFEQSGLIDMCLPHRDAIMCDKGFYIENICNSNFIKLIRPLYLKNKKQFTKQEAEQNACISKARVHVERVFQRVKIFQIFQTPLPWNLVPRINEIFTVVCGIVNLSSPVLADVKF